MLLCVREKSFTPYFRVFKGSENFTNRIPHIRIFKRHSKRYQTEMLHSCCTEQLYPIKKLKRLYFHKIYEVYFISSLVILQPCNRLHVPIVLAKMVGRVWSPETTSSIAFVQMDSPDLDAGKVSITLHYAITASGTVRINDSFTAKYCHRRFAYVTNAQIIIYLGARDTNIR